MKLSFLCRPTLESWLRTVFWTLFLMDVGCAAYGFAIDYGFTPLGNDLWSGYADEIVADLGMLFSSILLIPVAISLQERARWLSRLGTCVALFGLLRAFLLPRIHN